MERIAPLAKILAEANGIEWQGLHGSGEGGQIVEQDILDYLTRVMSGEADPPSTPVDAPPPDWNGEDIPGGGMFDASALSRAGVDTDIAQFVEQSRAPAAPAQSGPVSAASDFELDDGEEDLLLPPTPQPTAPSAVAPAMAAAPAPAAAPMLGRAGSVPTPATPATPAPTPAPAAPAAPAGGLGNLLSRLYQKPAAPAPEPAAPVAPVMPAAAPVSPQPVVPPVMAEPVQTPAAPEPVVPTPVLPGPVATPAPAPAPIPAHEIAVPAVAAPTPVYTPAPAQPEPEAAKPAAPAMPAPVMPAPVPAQPAATVQAPTSATPRDAVWFGTYLRREANVTGLMDLHGQLSEALGREVPLALLLARAAQHHAAALGLDTLAIQDVQASRVRAVQPGSLREALAGLDGDFGGTPDLLVVDAGALDLDDLHYPHALSLSVGRVQGGRVGLSLQGDVEPDKAARFLAGVAQTLEKPVVLLI